MNGWIITKLNIDIENFGFKNASNVEYIESNGYLFLRNHNGRFKNDSLFFETEDYVIVIDGVVLNRKELESKYNKTFREIITEQVKIDMLTVPKILRGPFSGAIFDKTDDKIIAFSNHTADSGVFYLKDENRVFSNNFRWIVKTLRENSLEYTLDNMAVKYMCTFGFMLDNNTFVESIKRVMPGEAIQVADGCITSIEYHHLNNYDTVDLTEDEYIEQLDVLFRQAIKREFDKDIEYGYKSIVDLSGGLDTRVINYVAKAMGYSNILNVSFSQTFSDEYKAMIALSRDLGFKLFHYPLDNATHLYDLDKIVSKTYGLSYYAGAGSIMSIMENINLDTYGLEHGGTLGEMAGGVFPGSSYTKHIKPTFEGGMPFGRVFSLDMLDKTILDKYENLELFTIVGRGMLGGGCTHLIRREFTGFTMAFGDIDFYDFFLSIPVEVRGKGAILQKWVSKKYPEAFDVIEDKLMCKPNASAFVKNIMLFKRKVRGKLIQYFGKHLPKLEMNNMNPMEYWYYHNAELRNFIEGYYNDNIVKLDSYPESKEMVQKLFEDGNIVAKLIGLTILSVTKQFFGSEV